jgi:hypothetical protein
VAKDEDVGLNALVKYRLKPDLFGNYKSFSIDENSGLITLKVSLNREKQKLYEVRNGIWDLMLQIVVYWLEKEGN